MPTTMATAPTTTLVVITWWVTRAPMGRAMTRLSVVIDCTTTSGPLSSATAWRIHPASCSPPPRSHTGLRRIWTRKLGCSPASSVESVPFCWRTLPNAKATAARRARTTSTGQRAPSGAGPRSAERHRSRPGPASRSDRSHGPGKSRTGSVTSCRRARGSFRCGLRARMVVGSGVSLAEQCRSRSHRFVESREGMHRPLRRQPPPPTAASVAWIRSALRLSPVAPRLIRFIT